jgi:hypothetical protein
VLRGGLGTGAISNERLNVTFQHHKTMKTLRESSDVVGCSVCRALADELEKREELDVTDNMEITIQAELSRLEDQESLVFETGSGDRILYRLDFTLEVQNLKPFFVHSFSSPRVSLSLSSSYGHVWVVVVNLFLRLPKLN